MKENIIREVLQRMLPYLDNAQSEKLQEVLGYTLGKYETFDVSDDSEKSNDELIQKFIEAKRIEGCSERTLQYYRKTIEDMLTASDKEVIHITTEDLRAYLTEYQIDKQLSKVTVDNVRRVLSSFFSWLEDEDYILKSPVRRIHKVKNGGDSKRNLYRRST